MALTPSKRVTLIKEIGSRLSGEEWPLIDVTLKQFGLPWSDDWRGSKDSYLYEMVQGANDQQLIELGVHVGLPLQEATPRLDPPFWRKGMLRLFITHLAANRAYAAQLQEALLGYGISGFVSHNDIEPTQEWQTQM